MVPEHRSGTPVQPSLTDLLARYLQRQTVAESAGLGMPEVSGEVFPHDAAPVQPVNPQTAWSEGLAAIRSFQPKTDPLGLPVPPEWATVVSTQEPMTALAFCAGNYPQLVRNLLPLLRSGGRVPQLPSRTEAVLTTDLVAWAETVATKKSFPHTLLAIGSLRLARHFDAAASLIPSAKKVPAEWRAALANEAAALAWHRGDVEQAAALWAKQDAHVVVNFNRGMAALFLGQAAEARSALAQAVALLPEGTAWHHLGRLYLTLAEAE